jgi:predicted permease
MVGIVLLIACANAANLFLVRAEGRQQELAVRAALGAGPGRIAREILAESVALGLAGGALGLALAWVATKVLVVVAPEGLPRLDEIGINAVVVLFTLALSGMAGVLFGLIPVARFAVPKVGALKDAGRSASGGRERHRVSNALIVAEVAMALVLLVSSGLMARTFFALRSVNPGYSNPDEVITFRITVPSGLVPDNDEATRVHEQLVRRLEEVPGITSVGLSSSVAMDGNTDNDPILFEDFPGKPGQMPTMHRHKWIGPGYFRAMQNRILAGRDLTWADLYNRANVAIISENLAKQYWKTPAEALGRRIAPSPKDPWREIVGVVGDERDDGVALRAPTIVFWPFLARGFWTQEQYMQRSQAYVVRSPRMASPGFLKELQQAVWSVNANLPLADVRTLDDLRARSMAQTSFMLVMLAIAAGVALLLGVVGIYGVVGYIAAQRTREAGIRIALGAQRRDVSVLFLRHGLVLTTIGVAVGIGLAAGLTRLMSAQLFAVSPIDPLTYAAVSVGLACVAMLATYLPARRAARVDPVIALRSEA